MVYTTQPLDASTWDAFAELVERNNGIFGGCWCTGYHLPEATAGRDAHGRFLFSATVEFFEQYGFRRVRQVGKHAS